MVEKEAMRKPRPALSTAPWRKLRAQVKQGAACAYCGSTVDLEADHRVPPAQGGSELDPANVVVACRTCNRSKGSRTLEQWRADAPPGLPMVRQRTVYSRRRSVPRVPEPAPEPVDGRLPYPFHQCRSGALIGDMNLPWTGRGCPPGCPRGAHA
jgi:HNH endonuclease